MEGRYLKHRRNIEVLKILEKRQEVVLYEVVESDKYKKGYRGYIRYGMLKKLFPNDITPHYSPLGLAIKGVSNEQKN